MIRGSVAVMLMVGCCLGGCASPTQAAYSCHADVSNRVAPTPVTPPVTDAAGDKTCE